MFDFTEAITMIKNTYYKGVFGGQRFMSGCNMPNPDDGPYEFIDCTFHPGLSNVLKQDYGDSVYVDCYKGF